MGNASILASGFFVFKRSDTPVETFGITVVHIKVVQFRSAVDKGIAISGVFGSRHIAFGGQIRTGESDDVTDTAFGLCIRSVVAGKFGFPDAFVGSGVILVGTHIDERVPVVGSQFVTGSHYFLGVEAGSFEIVFLFGLCGIATFTVMLACTEQIYTCQYAPCGRLRDTSRLVSKIGGRFQTSLGGICHFGDDEVIDFLLVRTRDVQVGNALGRNRFERNISPALYQIEIIECTQEAGFGDVLFFDACIETVYFVDVFEEHIGTVDA